VIAIEIGGSLLIIYGRHVWIGALILAAFTLATIPIAHDFWNMTGDQASMSKLFVMEHLAVIGALVLVAVAV
jgi:transmembrane protein